MTTTIFFENDGYKCTKCGHNYGQTAPESGFRCTQIIREIDEEQLDKDIKKMSL